MRIPLSISILLCLGMVAFIWWWGTRDKDFITPPSEAEIQTTRDLASRATPVPEQPRDAVSAPAAAQRNQPSTLVRDAPSLDPTELGNKPHLDEYRKQKSEGSDHLVELARLLQAEGHPQRALLAWERVLDSTHPNRDQTDLAIEAIRQLKPSLPPWNPVIAKSMTVTLNAGTTQSTATRIRPALEELAAKIAMASSGILRVKVEVAAGLQNLDQESTPVAIWISGETPESRSTDLASITVGDQTDIQTELGHAVYNILRTCLARDVALTPPAAITREESPYDAIHDRITRLAWRDLGNMLNNDA